MPVFKHTVSLALAALAVALSQVSGCDRKAETEAETFGRFVPFSDFLGNPVAGDVALAAPLRAPVADLHGEARDVALLQTSAKRVKIMRNNGSGAFSYNPTGDIALSAEPVAVAAADFDDDGDADLAVACRNPNVVLMLMNDGAGVFTVDPVREVALDGIPVAIVAQQFNEIGDNPEYDLPSGSLMDLAVGLNIAGEGGVVLILHNDGTRHVEGQTILTDRSPGVLDMLDDLDSSDVDTDKDIDLVLVAGSGVQSSVRVLLNAGGGAGNWELKEAQRFGASVGADQLTLRRVRCVDVMGDNLRDVLLTGVATTGPAPVTATVVARNGGVVDGEWTSFGAPESPTELRGAEFAAGRIVPGTPNVLMDLVALHTSVPKRFIVYRNSSTPGGPTLSLTRVLPAKNTDHVKGGSIAELTGGGGLELLSTTGYHTE